jgi:uncharacterized protein YcnI
MMQRPGRRLAMSVALALVAGHASAHVTVEPKEATAGAYAKLVFRIGHGCNGSPTRKITIELPEGVESARPKVHPGWQIDIARAGKPAAATGAHAGHGAAAAPATAISWTGGPLPDEYMDEFEISLKLPSRAGSLRFPVTQECETGSIRWVEVGGQGSEPAAPAPTVLLRAK